MTDQVEQSAESPNSDAQDNGAEEFIEATEESQHDDANIESDSQEQPPEDEDEIDVDGKKFVMPKSAAEKLKAERLMHADYTQKTQAIAAERRQVAEQAEAVANQQKLQEQYVKDLAKVVALDEQLAQFAAVDWQKAIVEDPVQAMQLQQQQRSLETQRAQAAHELTIKQEQGRVGEQQAFAKQAHEADAYCQREIPGWSDARIKQLQEYGAKNGMDARQVTITIIKNPLFAKMLNKAELFDQMEAKRTAAKPKPATQEKPVTRVTATRSNTTRDQEKMSADEWSAWRRADLAKKGKR